MAVVILVVTFNIFSTDEVKVDLNLYNTNAVVENIKNMELNMTSIIYVKNEKGKWEEYHRIHGEENRLWIDIDKVPKKLINAFIAIEDETFYEHEGINWRRTVGAVTNYFLKFDNTEFGGSTITQQLIKNITLDNDKKASRKIREIVRAILVEEKLSKTEILEAYLNTIALGNGICGVQVAANYYFNKDVNDLTLAECATIAAITKNPSKYNPVSGAKENKNRRNLVLKKMLSLGYITAEEFLDNYDKEIKLDNTQKQEYEPEINDYFVDTLIEQVIEDLMEKYNCTEDVASTMIYNGGYKIYSTVNPKIQQTMEKVYLNVNKYFPYKGTNLEGEVVHAQSAMTIMDYNGHILGIVGGAGEKTVNRGLNRAYNSPRQPGSTMKPLGVYALAIENDLIHYSSKVVDKPIPNYYPDGRSGPAEWYGHYKGTITVDYAIRKSANTIPVILLQQLGVNKSYNFLTKKLGLKHLTSADKNLASLALGGCNYGMTTTESAAAYAIFGNQGIYHKPTTYYKVVNIEGEEILKYNSKGKRAISAETATIMNHLLQGVVYGSEGTGGYISGFDYTMKAYAKTGTSSESKDLWMVAGTPYYVGSVWYGFDKQQTINSTSAAAVIWKDIMRELHSGLEPKQFEDSDGVYRSGSGYYKDNTRPDNYGTITGGDSSSESSTTSKKPTSSKPSSDQSTTSGDTSETTSTPSEDSTVTESTPVESTPVESTPTENPETPPQTPEPVATG